MRNLTAYFQAHPGKSRLLWIFALCALPLGLMIAVITPPGQSPDEPAQVGRAAGLLHGAILGVRKAGIDPSDQRPTMFAGVKVDDGLFVAAFGEMTAIGGRPVFTQQDLQDVRAELPNHVAWFADLPNTVVAFPAAFVPAAIGLGIGELLHQRPYVSFVLARLCMLLTFLLLGGAALAVAAFGEAFLLTILLLPMSVFLASTVNEDGVLIAATCLVCAALTRGTRSFWLGALCLFIFVLGAKPPYVLLLGVFLLPLFGPGFWRRVRDVAIACIPLFGWIAVIAAFVAVPFGYLPYHPGPLFAGNPHSLLDHAGPSANLHILLADPSRLVTMPLASLSNDGLQNLREMIGVLGPLYIVLPNPYYIVWGVSLLISFLGLWLCPRPGAAPSTRVALVGFITVIVLMSLTVWGIMMIAYLNWTLVGAARIQGIQGRYGLILLPFLVLAIPWLGRHFKLPAIPPLAPAVLTILLGVFDLAYIPAQLVYTFYLH
jgi:hypothetical protein